MSVNSFLFAVEYWPFQQVRLGHTKSFLYFPKITILVNYLMGIDICCQVSPVSFKSIVSLIKTNFVLINSQNLIGVFDEKIFTSFGQRFFGGDLRLQRLD